jgi:hypothetical protein
VQIMSTLEPQAADNIGSIQRIGQVLSWLHARSTNYR